MAADGVRAYLRSAGFRRLVALGLPLCCAGLSAGILIGRGCAQPLWALPAMLPAVLAAALLPEKHRPLALAAFMCALGVLLGWRAWHPAIPETGTHLVTGIVCDEVVTGDEDHVTTRLCDVTVDGAPAGSDAYWSWYGEVPEGLVPGCAVTVTASVYEPSGQSNPYGFDFQSYLYGKGMNFGLYGCTDCAVSSVLSLRGALAALRHTLALRLTEAMGEETGGFIAAMLLGTRSMVAEEDRAAFAKVGAAHILSVSGFHVSIVAGLLLLLMRRADGRAQLAGISVLLALYCLLTGGAPSVVRASLLTVASRLRRLTLRRTHSTWSLFTVYLLLLLVNPAQLVSSGFQMTFWAVAGIGLVTPAVRQLPGVRRLPDRLRSAVAASVGAQIGLLFPMLCWYQELQLIGIVLNLIVIPWASLLIGSGWLVLALTVWMPAAKAVGVVPTMMYQGLRWLVEQAGRLPFTTLWTAAGGAVTLIGCVLLLYGLGVARKDRRRRMAVCCGAGLALIVLSVIPYPHRGTEYIQLSVGSADSAVLWDDDTVTVIDTGEEDSDLTAFLHARRLGVDRLILTHLHSDHAGGVRSLLDEGIPVRELILPAGAEDQAVDEECLALVEELRAAGTTVRHVTRGDVLETGAGTLTVLWPEAEGVRAGGDANLYSLTLLAELKGTTLLLTGDLDGRYEMYAAAPADILKAAHHGSSGASSEDFLAAVAPQTVLVSCGDETRENSMRERVGGAAYYCTRTSGAILLRLTDGAYTVSTWK